MSRATRRPALRILSDSIKNFKVIGRTVMYNGVELPFFEVAGVCIEKHGKFMKVLDFCGEIPMTQREQSITLGLPYSFICQPYCKHGVVKIHCKSVRKIDIFEEIFFWAEAVNLRKKLGLQG